MCYTAGSYHVKLLVFLKGLLLFDHIADILLAATFQQGTVT